MLWPKFHLQLQVEYSADVIWTSPRGFLVEFVESGVQNVSITTATISGLVPDTEYYFRVSAVTDVGQGAEARVQQATAPALGGTYSYTYTYLMPCLCDK